MTRRVAFTNEAFGDWTVNGMATLGANVRGAYLALRNVKNPAQSSYSRLDKVEWKETLPGFAEVTVSNNNDSTIVKAAGFFTYYSTTSGGVLIETEVLENPTVTALKVNGVDVKPVTDPSG